MGSVIQRAGSRGVTGLCRYYAKASSGRRLRLRSTRGGLGSAQPVEFGAGLEGAASPDPRLVAAMLVYIAPSAQTITVIKHVLDWWGAMVSP
jgi:hypothetical protein